MMQKILDYHLSFYENLSDPKNQTLQNLKKRNIHILKGFIEQIDTVRAFYKQYYPESEQERSKLVLCGINPGRKGAGKTGVPFLDFKSLSQLLPNINYRDEEQSAQFIYKLISHIGAKKFFDNIYLTNISWLGFVGLKDGRRINVNYYELDEEEQEIFTLGFIHEMDILKPYCIIPLGEQVEKNLRQMQKKGTLKYKIGHRLNHPFYCSIKTNTEQGLKKYLEVIDKHFQKN